jgi:hypothetical protein
VWCSIPSSRTLRKSFLAFPCRSACGLCAAISASSTFGESAFFISESFAASHSVFMVHISSILLSSHRWPIVSFPLNNGKVNPFGANVTMPVWRFFHVAWWAAVIVSCCPKQYPAMCPTVWIGRSFSVTMSPFSSKMRLQMSHRLDVVAFLN